MSAHLNPDLDEPLRTDDSWMTPEQSLRVERIHLETMLNELEEERHKDRNIPFDEEIRHGIRAFQEKLDQITGD